MLEMKILIVEDDFSLALDVEMYLKYLGYSDISIIDNGRGALRLVNSENGDIDLVILDVNLNDDFTGIDVANKIIDKNIPIIFITILKDEKTFQEAMLTRPSGFLIKPFDKITLQSCIDRVFELKEKQSQEENLKSCLLEDSFFIKQNDILKRIEFDDILWIEADGNYIELHVVDKRYATKMSLTKVQQKINAPYFVRAHKKFLVNLRKVESINANSQLIINGRVIPIGSKFKTDLLKKIDSVDY